MSRAGFEPTIPALERAKTVHALDRAATVIGGLDLIFMKTRGQVGQTENITKFGWRLVTISWHQISYKSVV
jgi:hypothetical protein